MARLVVHVHPACYSPWLWNIADSQEIPQVSWKIDSYKEWVLSLVHLKLVSLLEGESAYFIRDSGNHHMEEGCETNYTIWARFWSHLPRCKSRAVPLTSVNICWVIADLQRCNWDDNPALYNRSKMTPCLISNADKNHMGTLFPHNHHYWLSDSSHSNLQTSLPCFSLSSEIPSRLCKYQPDTKSILFP